MAVAAHHRQAAAADHQAPAQWQTNLAGAVDDVPLFPCELGGQVAGVVLPPVSAGPADQYSQLLNLSHRADCMLDAAQHKQLVFHKRKRAHHSTVLDATVLASQAHRQRMDMDRLILNHTMNIWTGLSEQTQRYMNQMRISIEAKAAKQLQDKDKEIQKAIRTNWALEDRLKFFCSQAQVLRDIAQSNETTANALRGELEVLKMQSCHSVVADDAADDAESCCHGENEMALHAEEITRALSQHGMKNNQNCRRCGEFAAEVLLLPCRHLCACMSCAATVLTCPVCGCVKNGTICVNFS